MQKFLHARLVPPLGKELIEVHVALRPGKRLVIDLKSTDSALGIVSDRLNNIEEPHLGILDLD
jgi:hypothetical protein